MATASGYAEINYETGERPYLMDNGDVVRCRYERRTGRADNEFLRSCLRYGVGVIAIGATVYCFKEGLRLVAMPVATGSVIYEIINPEGSAVNLGKLMETNAIQNGLQEVFNNFEKYMENALGKDFKNEINPGKLDILNKIRVSSVKLCDEKTLQKALKAYEHEQSLAGSSGKVEPRSAKKRFATAMSLPEEKEAKLHMKRAKIETTADETTDDQKKMEFINLLKSEVLPSLPRDKVVALVEELQELHDIYSVADLSFMDLKDLKTLKSIRGAQLNRLLKYVQGQQDALLPQPPQLPQPQVEPRNVSKNIATFMKVPEGKEAKLHVKGAKIETKAGGAGKTGDFNVATFIEGMMDTDIDKDTVVKTVAGETTEPTAGQHKP